MTDDSIGVDISKDKLDCYRLSDGAFEQLPNTRSGFQKLRRWIGPDLPARVVFEPTGPYHGAFEAALAEVPFAQIGKVTSSDELAISSGDSCVGRIHRKKLTLAKKS